MRSILALAAACALAAGCSAVGGIREAWDWDPASPRPAVALTPAEAAALTNQVAQLQLQRDAIRSRISAEPDIRARQGLYVELHEVGSVLSPLQRRLAGVPSAR